MFRADVKCVLNFYVQIYMIFNPIPITTTPPTNTTTVIIIVIIRKGDNTWMKSSKAEFV